MADTLNWHDAHAMVLIDQALEQGRFTDDVVEEITKALHEAEHAAVADSPCR
jgi:hypothetical protein